MFLASLDRTAELECCSSVIGPCHLKDALCTDDLLHPESFAELANSEVGYEQLQSRQKRPLISRRQIPPISLAGGGLLVGRQGRPVTRRRRLAAYSSNESRKSSSDSNRSRRPFVMS